MRSPSSVHLIPSIDASCSLFCSASFSGLRLCAQWPRNNNKTITMCRWRDVKEKFTYRQPTAPNCRVAGPFRAGSAENISVWCHEATRYHTFRHIGGTTVTDQAGQRRCHRGAACQVEVDTGFVQQETQERVERVSVFH